MVSTWSSGSTFPPTNFQSMFDNSNPDDEFTFVDFLPECRSPSGIFTQAKYETFRSIVDRANDWLRANPQWEIKTCESVEFKDSGDVIKTEKMIYIDHKEHTIKYIRALRLWISKRKSDKHQSQQIGYINMVPDLCKEAGIFTSPKFESLADLVNRYNTMIRTQPVPGRIITIETQAMKMKSRNEIDPEKSNWYESGVRLQDNLYIIRIFFEITDPTENVPSEEIGLIDFIPNLLESGGIFKMPKYDVFSNTVLRASEWCARQTGIRICNAQSVEMYLKRGIEIDTQKTHFVDGGNFMSYVRILRVTYTKCPLASKLEVNPITQFTCKTFEPVQTSHSIFLPDYESLSETRARVSAWIKATGAHVISAETLTHRKHTGVGTRHCSPEASFTYSRDDSNEICLFVIRVYLNGIYKEPPIEMLPPLPVLQDQNCCIML